MSLKTLSYSLQIKMEQSSMNITNWKNICSPLYTNKQDETNET